MMKHHHTPFLAVALAATSAFAEVKVEVVNVSEQRALVSFNSGLQILAKLTGPEMLKAYAIRVSVEGKDDAGKPLVESPNPFRRDGFEVSEVAAPEREVSFYFANPPRAAKAISVTGTAEVSIPSRDPAATVTVALAKGAGKPIENAALKAAEVSISFKTPEGDELEYTIIDPKKVVVGVELVGADGKALATNGTSASDNNGVVTQTISLANRAPKGMAAKVHLVTEKSILKVAVKIETPLP
jgi:hypothetical protein